MKTKAHSNYIAEQPETMTETLKRLCNLLGKECGQGRTKGRKGNSGMKQI